MNRFIRVFVILLLSSVTGLYAQRTTININKGWNFTSGWEFNNTPSRDGMINIPHTWNLDALSGKADYHRGLGNYLYQLEVDPMWKDSGEVYVRFKGVNQSAEVYVNGRRVGSHQGGYTAFGFMITPYLNFTGRNTLWVRVNNARDLNVMPLTGNFNIYGGIYRDVELIVTPKVHISHTQYATSGVKVTPLVVTKSKATVSISAKFEGSSGNNVDIRYRLKDGSGMVIDTLQKNMKFGIQGELEHQWEAKINSPRLWNGTIDPYQYSVEVEAISDSNGKTHRDIVVEDFGLRYFSVNSDNEFMLNGEVYPIRGVTRVEDVAMLGSAIYSEQHKTDLSLMLEMGVNAIRLAYYPQSREFIEMCDREGIIVWTEIPFVGGGRFRDAGYNSSEEFQLNGQKQLQELIAQNYNSPSLIFLGLFNEIDQRSDDPLGYIKLLNSIVKQELPSLLTVGASNQDGQINFITDLIGFNLTFGWNSAEASDIVPWAEGVRREWPRLKVAVSEYGAGASIYQHEVDPQRPVVDSYWHPEEYQTALHEKYYRSMAGKGYFWGTYINSMFDWGAAHLKCGTRAGISDLGLVTFDRAVKKDAFFFYKANWNKSKPFVYITSRRYTHRKDTLQNIKVFSTADSVTLYVNNSEVSTLGNDGFGTFNFNDCVLKEGVNEIRAEALDCPSDSIEVVIQ